MILSWRPKAFEMPVIRQRSCFPIQPVSVRCALVSAAGSQSAARLVADNQDKIVEQQHQQQQHESQQNAVGRVCSLVQEKYQVDQVRLYSNSTCSHLCVCSQVAGAVVTRCRSLLCKNESIQCQRLRHRIASLADDCQCVDGDTICSMKSKMNIQSPGLYFSVGYSPVELRVVNRRAKTVVPMERVSGLLNRLLSRTIGQKQCRFSLTQHDSRRGQALFQVRLWRRKRRQRGRHRHLQLRANSNYVSWPRIERDSSIDRLFAQCHYPLRLLRLLILKRYPEIIHHPHMSVLKTARVLALDKASVKRTYSRTNHNMAAFRPLMIARQPGNSMRSLTDTNERNCAANSGRPWRLCWLTLILLLRR